MPRSTLRNGGAPLLALSDGLNERALRAAAARASQQEDRVEDAGEVDRVNVDGVVFNVQAQPPGGEGGDEAMANAAGGDAGAADDPFAFPADEVDGVMARDEDAAEMARAEEVVQEGEAAAGAAAAMAAAAEEETEEDDESEEAEAVVLPAQVVAPARNQANRHVQFAQPIAQPANVRPHNAGSRNNHRANNRHPAMQVPVRRRKVLR